MSVLVGKEAPDFTAQAVMPDNSIKADYNLKAQTKGKYAVLFFWPLDFTFVCPSEIIAFDNRVEEFKKRGAELIGISVDSQYTHYAWKNTPVDKGGIGNIRFPLVADLTKSIARSYDVLTGDAVAFRGTFLIDKTGKVRHQLINDLPLGRNVDETLRTLIIGYSFLYCSLGVSPKLRGHILLHSIVPPSDAKGYPSPNRGEVRRGALAWLCQWYLTQKPA
jgi:peroxiredoxin 2/4